MGCCISIYVRVLLGVVLGVKDGREQIKDCTVEAGVAEYYLDEDHDKQWRWITQ